jgi:hypothetical protein
MNPKLISIPRMLPPVRFRVVVGQVSVKRVVELHNRPYSARVRRDLAHQKTSFTDRELIALARQHDRRGLLLNDPEVDVKLRTG